MPIGLAGSSPCAAETTYYHRACAYDSYCAGACSDDGDEGSKAT